MADGSLSIGKMFGIDIELNWIFVFMILMFFIIDPPFGFALTLLFVCVLIHEIAHSVTARRNGIGVSKIILMPFGGASVIDETNIDKDVEFRISVVGPIMSLFLGGLFGILVLFTPAGPITQFVQVMFLLNILLGIFNILPIFPMDGGRVMRSYLERRMGQFAATMATVKASKYCMTLIVIGTIVFYILPNSYSLFYKEFIFLVTIIMIFFFYQGTLAEQNNAIIRRNTEGIVVKDALSREFALVDYGSEPSSLYQVLRTRKKHLLITRAPTGQYMLVNIFGSDALKGAKSIADMCVQIPNLSPDTALADALSKIDVSIYGVAAIVKQGRIVGVATGNHIRAFISLHSLSRRSGKAF